VGLLAILLAVAIFVPWTVGWRARHFGRNDLWVAGLAVATLAAVILLYFGLLSLAYNGYQEDFGSPPSHTLRLAIPVIAAAVLALAALFYVSGSKKR
jgi:hypothetical protein